MSVHLRVDNFKNDFGEFNEIFYGRNLLKFLSIFQFLLQCDNRHTTYVTACTSSITDQILALAGAKSIKKNRDTEK